MGFPRPTLRELVATAVGDISSRTRGSAYIKKSAERVLASVQAALANGLHGHFEWLQRQALPTTADIEGLIAWGVWLKIPRKGPTKAIGQAVFYGCVPGTNPPIGTQLQTVDGIVFETTTMYSATAEGTWLVWIKAVSAGSASNLIVDTPLALVSPYSGMSSNGFVRYQTTGGTDTEYIEDYRARILDGLRLPPAGGGPGDYEKWALEIPGVTRAWEIGNQMGFGTVSVAFVMDDRASPIPLAADVVAVQANIDAKRPLDMRAVYVQAPIPAYYYLTVRISPNTDAVRAAITKELRYLFARETALATPLSVSKVDEAISTATGEDTHVILSQSSLDPGPWGILVFGGVSFG